MSICFSTRITFFHALFSFPICYTVQKCCSWICEFSRGTFPETSECSEHYPGSYTTDLDIPGLLFQLALVRWNSWWIFCTFRTNCILFCPITLCQLIFSPSSVPTRSAIPLQSLVSLSSTARICDFVWILCLLWAICIFTSFSPWNNGDGSQQKAWWDR